MVKRQERWPTWRGQIWLDRAAGKKKALLLLEVRRRRRKGRALGVPPPCVPVDSSACMRALQAENDRIGRQALACVCVCSIAQVLRFLLDNRSTSRLRARARPLGTAIHGGFGWRAGRGPPFRPQGHRVHGLGGAWCRQARARTPARSLCTPVQEGMIGWPLVLRQSDDWTELRKRLVGARAPTTGNRTCCSRIRT